MNQEREPIVLRREVRAVQIPSGLPMTLAKETPVEITQSLGGTYTVMTPQGLARISGRDADALGIEEAKTPPAAAVETRASGDETPEEIEKAVWAELRTCFDPEIPVNVVDLGLVYSCQVQPVAEGGFRAEVRFTLTAPGCGMGDWLRQDMQTKIANIPGVKETDVEVVFEPQWNQQMMSEAAKLELGML